MKIVLFSILTFLAIIGISHIVFEIYYRFLKLRNDNAFIVIIPDKKNNIDIEFSIRSAIAKSKKLFKNGTSNIFIISDNLDENSKKELSLLKKDYEYLQIETKEDFIKKAGL